MSKTIKIRRVQTEVTETIFTVTVPNDWELGEEGEDELERLAERSALEGMYHEEVLDVVDADPYELVQS